LLSNKKNLAEFQSSVFKKEELKQKFFEYWKTKQFDVLISPILPFPAIIHGDGTWLLNTLSLSSF